MAHWFHRNPLKATAPVNFDLRTVSTNSQSMKVCTDLRHARANLLEVVSNPNNAVSTLQQAFNTYMSSIAGFLVSFDDRPGDSKMRFLCKFKWTDTLYGKKSTEIQDSVFEVGSMLVNIGLWYSKHSAKLAGNEEPSMEEAKEIHKCLRTAAGVFTHVKEQIVARLLETPEKGTDLDARVLAAYIHQCTAEAQEVTIARAIELKHQSSIISALAYETARMYTDADDSLVSLDDKLVMKWRKYIQFKKEIYYAYAYNYHGVTLLAEDKCGLAIRCLQESKTHYDKATSLAKEYASTKGAGTTCKPQEHLFYRKLGPIVGRTLEKCVRENGFIYHQKIPPEAPALELKATYGLVAPEELVIPSPSPLWNPDTYKAFDLTKVPPPEQKPKTGEEKEGSEELPPVKETDIPQSTKDPSTFSGCVVS